jgi:hypothetical protein
MYMVKLTMFGYLKGLTLECSDETTEWPNSEPVSTSRVTKVAPVANGNCFTGFNNVPNVKMRVNLAAIVEDVNRIPETVTGVVLNPASVGYVHCRPVADKCHHRLVQRIRRYEADDIQNSQRNRYQWFHSFFVANNDSFKTIFSPLNSPTTLETSRTSSVWVDAMNMIMTPITS